MRVSIATIKSLGAGMICWAVPVFALVAWAGTDPSSTALTRSEYDQVRQLVVPQAQEALWDQVRWVPTLWEAQARAAQEGKPVVVFATGGEPLGIC